MGKIIEPQAGFRHAYSTADHIFTSSVIVKRCLGNREGKLYVAFVGLHKAFDSP